jgi:hypothetical protein
LERPVILFHLIPSLALLPAIPQLVSYIVSN